jgi:hypothetical protein
MRNQAFYIVTLSIALAISPAVSFARGGGSSGGSSAGGGSHFSSGGGSSGSNTPYFGAGHGWGGNANQKPKPGNGNKAGSKPVNCKAGGEGCYHQQ